MKATITAAITMAIIVITTVLTVLSLYPLTRMGNALSVATWLAEIVRDADGMVIVQLPMECEVVLSSEGTITVIMDGDVGTAVVIGRKCAHSEAKGMVIVIAVRDGVASIHGYG